MVTKDRRVVILRSIDIPDEEKEGIKKLARASKLNVSFYTNSLSMIDREEEEGDFENIIAIITYSQYDQFLRAVMVQLGLDPERSLFMVNEESDSDAIEDLSKIFRELRLKQ